MKKGFTLVELLGVITILAILMIMATPAVLSISKKNRYNMYCKKVKTVVKAAQLYGEDRFSYLDNTITGQISENLVDGNTSCAVGGEIIEYCQLTTIGNLADKGFLRLEKVGKSSAETEFLDPRDFKSMLTNQVMVYIVNKRVNAQFIFNSKEDADKCTESVEVGGARYKSYYYKEGGSIKTG